MGKGKGLGIGHWKPRLKPQIGTDADDTLTGTDDRDRINAGDGSDLIFGGLGADRIKAGDGDDRIVGGAGNDIIFGNRGYDTAVFEGSILDFQIEEGRGRRLIVTDTVGDGGRDRLKHIEALEFDDFVLTPGANTAPLIKLGALSTDEDSPFTFTFDAYDFDGGTLSVDAVSVTGGSLSAITPLASLTPAGGSGARYQLTFDPGAGYQSLALGEQATETFSLTVSDGQGGTSIVTQQITITGVNDAPSANDSTGSVTEDGALQATGTVNAQDIDGSDVLGYTVVGGGTGTFGSLSVDTTGHWTYVLDNDAAAVQALSATDSAVDSFVVLVSDGKGGSTTAKVDVTVNGADDALSYLLQQTQPQSTTGQNFDFNFAGTPTDAITDGLLTVQVDSDLNGANETFDIYIDGILLRDDVNRYSADDAYQPSASSQRFVVTDSIDLDAELTPAQLASIFADGQAVVHVDLGPMVNSYTLGSAVTVTLDLEYDIV